MSKNNKPYMMLPEDFELPGPCSGRTSGSASSGTTGILRTLAWMIFGPVVKNLIWLAVIGLICVGVVWWQFPNLFATLMLFIQLK